MAPAAPSPTHAISSLHLGGIDPITNGERLNFVTLNHMAEYIASGRVALVDAVFCDPLGVWHHCTFAPSQCTIRDLEVGFAFDGSSIKLFTSVDQSDMLMKPDHSSCWIDPFCKHRTLHVVCSITDPWGKPFESCPRQIASKAASVVSELGIADTCIFGPEAEFFIFDHVRFNVSSEEIAVELDSEEASWSCSKRANSSSGIGNLGHRVQKKCMYFPVAPTDTMMDLRSDMLLTMASIGLDIEKHHHEVAICQGELGFTCDQLVRTADNLMAYKYIVKNVARFNGKTATFMPKPIYGDNGSGLHVHQSLWANGKNLFFDSEGYYYKLSKMAMYYLGGILKHAPAILAFTNPSTNSYKRLVPGYEAPCNLFYSKGNRSAAIRIPLCDGDNPKAKRLECRFPDPTACVYLAFAVLLMAGIDGIINKIEPPEPIECDIFDLKPEERAKIPSTPPSLNAALDALESDHEFLLRESVFTKSFIMRYIMLKRDEARTVELIPHPKEFELYYHL